MTAGIACIVWTFCVDYCYTLYGTLCGKPIPVLVTVLRSSILTDQMPALIG